MISLVGMSAPLSQALRRHLCNQVSWVAMLASVAPFNPALAQDAGQDAVQESAQADNGGQAETNDIVVTGTRLQTGFQAPTPVTVLGSQEIANQAPRSITDVVSQIPSIVGSMTPAARSTQASNGTQGISAPALRGVGSNRTLVLIDGKRSPPVTQTGETDIEMIPQQLVTRVDVVTGGASAAYGSDALAGVVNFVLDHDFTGLKGEVSGGFTEYGDGNNYKVALSGGFKFADGRGHIMVSGEHFRNYGIMGSQTGTRPKRDWLYGSPGIIANPAYTATNGLPQYITVDNFSSAAATRGGIIVNTALRGTAFRPDGTPYQFNFGTLERVAAGGIPIYMGGGDWQDSDASGFNILDPKMRRDNLFGRASFDVTDRINIFVQGGWNKNYTRGGHSTFAQLGDMTVQADNAFLPEEVAERARQLGISSFRYGRYKEGERRGGEVGREVFRFQAGAEGKMALFGSDWNWDVYGQRGTTKSREEITGMFLVREYNQSIDAVRNSAGQIVCRVNADMVTTNDDPACVPYNIFGFPPVLDPAVDNYAYGGGHPTRHQKFTQTVFAGSLSGEPFSTWAGPVSLAVGAEYRKEEAEGSVDERSLQQRWATNLVPLNGSYSVKEAFLEVAVPLAEDLPFAQSLEFNGAVRGTDYSVSGFVTTWKAGVTWAPIDDIRFRVTRSRDIRAPNLSELFTQGLQNTNIVSDPFRNGENCSQCVQVSVGSTDLQPEVADTLGLGVVFRPSFLPGFNASVDYYKISIKDAIGTLTPQQIVNECFAGRDVFCGAIERATSGTPINGVLPITRVRNSFFNFASQTARGIDFEVSYRLPMEKLASSVPGDLSLRLFATRFLENTLANGVTAPFDMVGDMRLMTSTPQIGGIPKWKGTGSLTYTTDPITVSLMARFISAGKMGGPPASPSSSWVECSTACPTSTALNPTIDDNHVPAAAYFDANIAWRPANMPGRPEFFFSVRNLANKDPVIVARGPGQQAYGERPTNVTLYDMFGRTYRAGIRFNW